MGILSFLSLFLLARYMRLCKLVTCRLILFHFMDFQSIVIGFVGLQILLFGVILIICHQFIIYFYFTIAFYTHVVHLSKFGTDIKRYLDELGLNQQRCIFSFNAKFNVLSKILLNNRLKCKN